MTTLVPEPEAESGKSRNTRFKVDLEGHTLQAPIIECGNTEFPKGGQMCSKCPVSLPQDSAVSSSGHRLGLHHQLAVVYSHL